MFVSDKVVFIELHKTGCTHIRDLLGDLVGGEFAGKHNQVDSDLFSGNRVFLGSVRDPWEWYISLWAYGCDRKGIVFGNVTKGGVRIRGHGWKADPYQAFRELLATRPNNNSKKWRRTYQDVKDAGAFREWLCMMHDEQYWSDFGEGYGRSSLSRIAGLFTFRYMKLFSCKDGEPDGLDRVSSFDQLAQHERKNCFIDHFIRNENLESDLFVALERSGFEIPGEVKAEILARSRTNTSSRKHGPGYYYDAETEHLVFDRDKLVVEKFGYVAPGSRIPVPGHRMPEPLQT